MVVGSGGNQWAPGGETSVPFGLCGVHIPRRNIYSPYYSITLLRSTTVCYPNYSIVYSSLCGPQHSSGEYFPIILLP